MTEERPAGDQQENQRSRSTRTIELPSPTQSQSRAVPGPTWKPGDALQPFLQQCRALNPTAPAKKKTPDQFPSIVAATRVHLPDAIPSLRAWTPRPIFRGPSVADCAPLSRLRASANQEMHALPHYRVYWIRLFIKWSANRNTVTGLSMIIIPYFSLYAGRMIGRRIATPQYARTSCTPTAQFIPRREAPKCGSMAPVPGPCPCCRRAERVGGAEHPSRNRVATVRIRTLDTVSYSDPFHHLLSRESAWRGV